MLVVASTVLVIVYVIGIPVSFALLLDHGSRNDLLKSEEWLGRCGFLYRRYENRWWDRHLVSQRLRQPCNIHMQVLVGGVVNLSALRVCVGCGLLSAMAAVAGDPPAS